MTARCAEVLSPPQNPPGMKVLRILETVEGFVLQPLDEHGQSLGDLLFETMDEAMQYVYSHYGEISDWKFCPDDAGVE